MTAPRLSMRGMRLSYGSVTVLDDAFTGETPGRLVRGPQHDPR